MKRISLFLVISVLVVSGCSWVTPSPEAQQVTVAKTAAVVSHCQRLGTTTVTTKAKLGFIPRAPKKIEQELVGLAKNSAGEMGGNAILAQAASNNGVQTFVVYRCQ